MTEQSAGVEFLSIGLGGIRFESLFETIPLSIAIFDADLRLTSANSRYRELTGVDAPASTRLSI
jgi:PAS domain-containing protein